MSDSPKIDVERIKAENDIAVVIGKYVQLRVAGAEFEACCPFHSERTPSFTVNPNKGFYHCFGCGAHGDVIRFVQEMTGVTFVEACEQLGAQRLEPAREGVQQQVEAPLEVKWEPVMPVPDDAPELMATGGWTVPLWNPKRGKTTRMKPVRVDAYRDAGGQLLGYVLRANITDRDTGARKKWTPQVTWCVSPEGRCAWCLQHFPSPRPLLGLDDLAARPDAPVLLVEGEKCRAAGAGAFRNYVVMSWPGGSNGIGKVDWSPLRGRTVVLWPDADEAGDKAMFGWNNDAGQRKPGIAQLLWAVGVVALRAIDPAGMPKGWDIADALDANWSPKQLATWAQARVEDVVVAA
ncbi:DNA primase [Stenotrophomonas sp. CW117]|uniref:DNA primase n=1 Tax=Stenotrophomonas TaxID=40323 RepID=UPI00177D9A40|nr:DNA primase [Stenotrophomonas sp. CW117]QOF99786.1 DNA primase [Stenotrophomonas sp. CW117]